MAHLRPLSRERIAGIAAILALTALPLAMALAAEPEGPAPGGVLATTHRHATLTSTVPNNGDLNPYAVIVAPVSAGRIRQNDVLVDNFNNISNLQGTGGTIVDYSPATRKTTLVASLPQHMAQCPGGIGLTAAMTMLKSGWLIVGSAPSTDGTTATKGNGCLVVLDPNGRVAAVWTGPDINDPWGNMAVIDRGASATLFVSMAGFDVPGPSVLDPKTGDPKIVDKATVLRLDLAIAPGSAPRIAGETVIGSGFGEQADKGAFLIGPTGQALGPDGTLYVSDAVGNRIAAIPDAATRTTSAGTGRTVTEGRLLKRPLAIVMAPGGELLVTNAKNGQIVEVNAASGKQLYAQWIDADQAQSPPGNGDLFSLAMMPDGTGFYYVEDDVNTLMEASR